jgi:hypothetical protein
MQWEEKLAVLQSLQPGEELLRMLGPGVWRCRLPGYLRRKGERDELKNYCVRCSPAEAVHDAFVLLEDLKRDEYVVIVRHLTGHHYRWSGTCWIEVQP